MGWERVLTAAATSECLARLLYVCMSSSSTPLCAALHSTHCGGGAVLYSHVLHARAPIWVMLCVEVACIYC